MPAMVDGLSKLHLRPAGKVDVDPHRGGEAGRRNERRGRGAPSSSAMPRLDTAADFTCMFGIPDDELTPRVRRALASLLTRFDEVRKRADVGREREAYLQGLADGDAVLPVGNRRYLVRELSRIIDRGRMAETTNTFVLVSIANGGRIRVKHGEAAIHATMCTAAGVLISAVRASDVVASLGGYDFGMVLTLAASDAAAVKIHSLATTLAAWPYEHEGGRLRLDVDWGLHEIGRDDSPDAVIAAADRDLVARGLRSPI